MKKIVFTFISYCIIFNLHAQKQGQARIDSLLAQLPKAKEDSNKVNLLNALSYGYSSIEPDTGMKYGQDALTVSEKIKWRKGMAESSKVIGINYFNKSDYSEAMKYYDKGLKIAREINYKVAVAEITGQISVFYNEQANYTKALEYALNALKMSEELNNKNAIANILYDIGGIYYNYNDTLKTLEYSNKALKMFEELNNEEGEASTLNDIGCFYANNNNTKALEYFNKALAINEQLGYKRSIARNLGNIADYYIKQKNYLKAFEFGFKSLNFSEKIDDKRSMTSELGSIGEYYLYIAKDTSDKILPDSLHNKRTILRKAIAYLEQSNKISKEQGLLFYLQIFSKDLSEAQELSGNYKAALESYKQHISFKDSIFSIESKRKIAELETKRETDLKQKEIEILNKDKAIQASEIKRQTLIRNAVLGGAIIAAIFSFLLVRSYNHRRKAAFEKERIMERNQLIEKQKTELENQVAERTAELKQSLENLKSTQKQLIQSEKMASLGEITAGIAHEIQNPLNFVNNFSEINTELIDEMKNELQSGNAQEALKAADSIRENNSKIEHHGKRADAIVKSMLQHSRISTDKKEMADINVLAEEYLRLSYHGLQVKEKFINPTINKNFDETIVEINIVAQDIGRVLVNLYNNAFYSVAQKKLLQPDGYEPTLSVTTKKLADKIEIRVRDNGLGIPQKVLNKIFQPFFTTKPTGQGTGLGLWLSYDIIKAQRGELTVETKEGEYAEFIIQLQIKETI